MVKVVAAQSLDVSAVPVIIQGRIWLARAAASCWVARDVGHLLSGNPQLVEIRMAFWARKTGTNRAHSSLIGLYSRGWRFVLWPYENRNWPTTSMIGCGGGFLWIFRCCFSQQNSSENSTVRFHQVHEDPPVIRIENFLSVAWQQDISSKLWQRKLLYTCTYLDNQ